MAYIPAYAPKGPLVARPQHLMKYSEPVTELVTDVINGGDDFWAKDDTGEEKPAFVVSLAAPTNDRFLVMLSVPSDDAAEDPHNVELAQRVIKRVEQKFPELVAWMDWTISGP